MAHEGRIDKKIAGQMTANLMTQKRFQTCNSGGFQSTYGKDGFQGSGSRGGQNNKGRGRRQWNNSNRPQCQLCGKLGHTVQKYYYRFDISFTGVTNGGTSNSKQNAQAVANFARSSEGSSQERGALQELSAGTDQNTINWYPDSGATNHLTNEFNNLSFGTEYKGKEKICMGNGAGLGISNVGHSHLSTNSRTLVLKNLLHVLKITKNLISVSQFAKDNSVFFEFHPYVCFVKDQAINQVLLEGALHNGLYKFSLIVEK
ncbi:hypothetical protein Dimus_039527 [Dionaea muscipula]